MFDVSIDLMVAHSIDTIHALKLHTLAYYAFDRYGYFTGNALFSQQFYD